MRRQKSTGSMAYASQYKRRFFKVQKVPCLLGYNYLPFFWANIYEAMGRHDEARKYDELAFERVKHGERAHEDIIESVRRLGWRLLEEGR